MSFQYLIDKTLAALANHSPAPVHTDPHLSERQSYAPVH